MTAEILIAAGSGILAAVAGIKDLASPTIYSTSDLRLFCILGALGGAFLSIAIFPVRQPASPNYGRRMAAKFAASGISGVLFTPLIFKWTGWPLDVDLVLGVSGVFAMISVSLIASVVPRVLKKVSGKVDDTPL